MYIFIIAFGVSVSCTYFILYPCQGQGYGFKGLMINVMEV